MSSEIPNWKHYRKVKKPLGEFRKIIDGLDLECISIQLSKKDGMHLDLITYFIKKYRNFLYLSGSAGEVIIPTVDVDVIWNMHTLDTIKYGEDCQRAFGFYLHPFSFFGIMGDTDAKRAFDEACERSSQLYEACFGEAYETQEAINLDPELNKKLSSSEDRSCD